MKMEHFIRAKEIESELAHITNELSKCGYLQDSSEDFNVDFRPNVKFRPSDGVYNNRTFHFDREFVLEILDLYSKKLIEKMNSLDKEFREL